MCKSNFIFRVLLYSLLIMLFVSCSANDSQSEKNNSDGSDIVSETESTDIIDNEITWQNYAPEFSPRVREETEWSISYSYNATDEETPRVLLIGDSICNGYNNRVRELLNGKVNVTFWATSKCITDPDYFKELQFYLEAMPYSMICFNNGLHSFTTDRAEWEDTYNLVVSFITEKLPDVPLAITLCTPLKDAAMTKTVVDLNNIALSIAESENLRVIDLFEIMDPLDRNVYWSDTHHFTSSGVDKQAQLISEHVLEELDIK